MLHFILGKAGSGKSKFLKNFIHKNIKNGGKNIILLVPEQSSFANEKEIIDILGNAKCNNVNVLSFSRLHDFVAKKLGHPTSNPMNTATQNILMNLAIENVKDQLEIYYPNSKTDIEKIMLETARDFKFQKIKTENLETVLNASEKSVLKKKALEISLILNEYNNLCSNCFIDAADKINLLEIEMKQHNLFNDYTVVFDEFNSFTEQQLGILELIISQAKDTYMAFCVDNPNNRKLFYPVNKTIENIKKMAKKHSVQISENINLTTSPRFLNNEMILLEENIFDSRKKSFDKPPKNINLYSALNVYEECENVARNICKLVIQENYRYNDIAILTRNMDNYQSTLKNTLKKHNIPLFLDCSETILDQSLINLVISALNCIISNFQISDVLKYIKSALLDSPADEIYQLENYALLWNISSNKWTSTFVAHPKGYCDHWDEDNLKTLENINNIKTKLITPLVNLKNAISRNNSARNISAAIYNLLIEVHADVNLKKLYINLKSSQNVQTAQKEAKTWDTLMELLSMISQILGNKKISLKDYTRILISSLESIDCSSIPPSQDSVFAAKIPGARLSNKKIIFLLGVSDGEFPAIPKPSAAFTESETSHLESLGVKICENKDYMILKEQFLAYTSICSASEKLYISWAISSRDDEPAKSPSEIIREIVTIFPNIKINTRNNYNIRDSIWSENAAFDFYCHYKNKPSVISNTLGYHFSKSPNYAHKLHSLENFSSNTNLNFKHKENSKKLFGNDIKLSASQIDYYHKCPFGYLCKYGLKLKSFKPAKFSPIEYGNLMHKMFEKLFKKYPQNKILDVPLETLKENISEIINDYAQSLSGNEFLQNPRTKNIIENAKKSAVLLIERLINEFKHSSFVVSDCELEISRKNKIKPLQIDLGGDSKVEIEGKVDRIDVMQTENKTYLRIVDYKTKKTNFELTNILYGLDIQTLIYLLILSKSDCDKYNHVVPSGALYFSAFKPTVDVKPNQSEEALNQKITQDLRMNGLLTNDDTILNAMDNSENKDFINIKNNEKNKISQSEFENIFRYLEEIIKNMGTNLQNGVFDINPTASAGTSSAPCEYCDYIPICHHSKDKFQKVTTQKRENIFSQIDQKRSEFFSE